VHSVLGPQCVGYMGSTVSVSVNSDSLNFPRSEYSFNAQSTSAPGIGCYSYVYEAGPSFEMSNSGTGQCRGSWSIDVTHIPTGETKSASIEVVAKSSVIE